MPQVGALIDFYVNFIDIRSWSTIARGIHARSAGVLTVIRKIALPDRIRAIGRHRSRNDRHSGHALLATRALTRSRIAINGALNPIETQQHRFSGVVDFSRRNQKIMSDNVCFPDPDRFIERLDECKRDECTLRPSKRGCDGRRTEDFGR